MIHFYYFLLLLFKKILYYIILQNKILILIFFTFFYNFLIFIFNNYLCNSLYKTNIDKKSYFFREIQIMSKIRHPNLLDYSTFLKIIILENGQNNKKRP